MLVLLMPAMAGAQAPGPQASTTSASSSKLWLVAGSASATLRSDCQTCEEDFPYRHSASVLIAAGRRLNDRADLGVELFWLPVETQVGRAHVSHIDAVVQVRPWQAQGFFIKAGAGMAFVGHWVDTVVPAPSNQKALSVMLGAGWVFWPQARFGVEIFGAQHAGAIGDVKGSVADIQDVMANFWSVGAAVVIR